MQKEIVPFFNKITDIYSNKLPFVVYRKPNEELVSLISQNEPIVYELTNFNEAGFVFVPFHNRGKKVLFPLDKSSLFHSKISQYDNLSIKEDFVELKNEVNSDSVKKNHIELVEKGLHFIQNNKAKKIVLSREEVNGFSHFDMVNTYKKMLKNYANAFVYCWFHPEIGLWMGATPERLINLKQQVFKTMALAGTQPFLGSTQVEWKEKEKQEQQFVTDYIVEKIKDKINIQKISEPYTVRAGNLLHLRTDIFGELSNPNLLEDLINTLHPTPAVCGLPKESALQFILKNENYTRTYYSGYLGELNIKNATQLFVNLRCMQLFKNEAKIFVGGGITLNSIPEKEYEETVSKSMVMKSVF